MGSSIHSSWVWWFSIVLSRTGKRLQVGYRPIRLSSSSVLVTPYQRMLIIWEHPCIRLSLSAQRTGGFSRSFGPVLRLWGFAGESWASLARHEVPMIASSPGLGISALNGWDAGFAGKLCMNIHSCKNVPIATTRGWEFKKSLGQAPTSCDHAMFGIILGCWWVGGYGRSWARPVPGS